MHCSLLPEGNISNSRFNIQGFINYHVKMYSVLTVKCCDESNCAKQERKENTNEKTIVLCKNVNSDNLYTLELMNLLI